MTLPPERACVQAPGHRSSKSFPCSCDGAPTYRLLTRCVYREFPGAPDWDELSRLWEEHPNAVGVWDSTRGILRTLGLDEDRAAEVGRFMDPLVEFTLSRGIATLLIDHVAKAATDSTGYARGSGDKLAAVQAQWFVKKARAFDETEAGELELVRWKARSGALNRTHRFAVGDGQGALTFRRLDPTSHRRARPRQRSSTTSRRATRRATRYARFRPISRHAQRSPAHESRRWQRTLSGQ